MVWFYERAGQRLVYEVRPRIDGPGLEIVLTYPDGHTHTEVITDDRDLSKRISEFQDSLVCDGWTPQGPWSRDPRR
jgi:hypothetical protein